MAHSGTYRRYYRESGAAVAMHVTVLQPLLILVAIAIVSGVPLLGAVSSGTVIGASSAVARGAESESGHRCPELARKPASRRAAAATCTLGLRSVCESACATQREWAVGCGASVLPPPRN